MKSIMIVDDSKIMRVLLKDFFESSNFLVVAEASNGFEAINLFHKYNPDFIVMDLQMPIMNGIEALSKIKQIDTKANIIIISAYADKQHIMDAITNGANGFILKPLNLNKLKKITHLFNLHEKMSINNNGHLS